MSSARLINIINTNGLAIQGLVFMMLMGRADDGCLSCSVTNKTIAETTHSCGSSSSSNSSCRPSSYHRLNGSSSPVLTATSLSYGQAKNSTHHRIKTPDPIKIKFGMVDYVGEGTRHAKFYANPFKGGFPANG